MADQWLLDRIKSQSTGTPAPTPVPAGFKPTDTPVSPSTNQPAEKPKLFQGSLLNKIFDFIRLPEYAQASFAQGGVDYAKSKNILQDAPVQHIGEIPKVVEAGIKNIPQGVMNRTEFGREDGQFNAGKEMGINNKYGQTAVNFGLSLAAPQISIGKLPGIKQGVEKVTKTIANTARSIEPVAKVIEKVDPYFRNPELGKMVQQAEERTQTRLNDLFTLVQRNTKDLSPAEQARVGQLLEGGVTTNGKYAQIAQEISKFSDEVGQEAVDLGLLTPETFQKFKGQYMSHIWNDMVTNGADSSLFAKSQIPKVAGKFFQKRKGAEGYVKQFGPAVFKGLGTEIKDIESAKLFKQIAEKYGINAMNAESLVNPEDYRYINKAVSGMTNKLDPLKGMVVPKEIADYVEKKVIPKTTSGSEKLMNGIMDYWKKGKTIYNPAYHVRNKVSNQILADFSTGQGIPKTVIGDVKAMAELSGKGDQTFVEAAKSVGLIGRQSFGEMFDTTLNSAGLETGKNVVNKVDQSLTKFQNASEEAAKLNVFKYWMNKLAKDAKVAVSDALNNQEFLTQARDKAEEAIFSPYRISSAERGFVKNIGIPFYSFARQSVPFVSKTIANNPGRVTKYEKLKTAVEGLSPEGQSQNKDLPEYAQGTIRTPIKDKNGNYYRVDPQYIYPYGSLDELGFSQGRLPFGLSLNPLVSETYQQMTNKDLYFGNDIATSNQPGKATKQRLEHAARTILPTLYSTIGYPASNILPGGDVPGSNGKLYGSLTGQKDYAGRTRIVPSAVLDAVGVKNSAIDINDQKKFNQIDRNKKRKSILSEIQNVRKDARLAPEERSKQIKDLMNQLKSI